MATRDSLTAEVTLRLKDPAHAVWTENELHTYINTALEGLYPTYFRRMVEQTVAGAGPIQTLPIGAKNLYQVGYKKSTSRRARLLRKWGEGTGEAYIPRTAITGDALVWMWTTGWVASDYEDIETIENLPTEAIEAVVLRTCITAMERILQEKERLDQYLAIQAREDVSEQDIAVTLDALHATLDRKVKVAHPLPLLFK